MAAPMIDERRRSRTDRPMGMPPAPPQRRGDARQECTRSGARRKGDRAGHGKKADPISFAEVRRGPMSDFRHSLGDRGRDCRSGRCRRDDAPQRACSRCGASVPAAPLSMRRGRSRDAGRNESDSGYSGICSSAGRALDPSPAAAYTRPTAAHCPQSRRPGGGPTLQIGPYEVERSLGRGGMGEVFLARDTHLHRPVAIKVVHPELLSHPDARARFLREGRLAASIVNPFVATVFDVLDECRRRRRLTGESWSPSGLTCSGCGPCGSAGRPQWRTRGGHHEARSLISVDRVSGRRHFRIRRWDLLGR